MTETMNAAAWRRVKNTAAIVIHRWSEERRTGVVARIVKCVNASVRGKKKAWRLSLVAEDDLIARALILQESNHQPFLDLLDEIGEREVFAVLIDAVDARSEFLDSAIAAADRIRALQAAEDATAMQQVIGQRDGLEEEITTKERDESDQRKAAQELSKAVRNERAGRRRAVALEIKDWLAREQG